jgi:hypothetical protein
MEVFARLYAIYVAGLPTTVPKEFQVSDSMCPAASLESPLELLLLDLESSIEERCDSLCRLQFRRLVLGLLQCPTKRDGIPSFS